MTGYRRISKRAFFADGGLSNPRHLRVMRKGTWAYFWRLD